MDDYVEENRRAWTEAAKEAYVADAEWAWALDEIVWGQWSVPESELRVLGDVSGLDVVELGCGTAYFSSWLARRGARVTGVDVTPAQLETARRMQREHDLEFPLFERNAEETGLPDAAFDLALSEYGASLWCDPYKWIPEAARLLRPGGRLVFVTNGLLSVLCSAPDDEEAGTSLKRDQFGLHRVEWTTDEGIEFHIPHGKWIDVLAANGFTVERLVEVEIGDRQPRHETFISKDWARRWPGEEIWVARA
jgi:SAM-dependent methyltransferase